MPSNFKYDHFYKLVFDGQLSLLIFMNTVQSKKF